MGMRIIRGAIGSQKTGMCIGEIAKIHEKYPDKKCIMIVPDHYSYETEKRFVERFGGTGLNNIEALTLRKMAINCLSAAELKYLTPAGKQMLIYKSVHSYCEKAEISDAQLMLAMKKAGFLDVVVSLISEMKRYSVLPENLLNSAEKIENETLKNKVRALGSIYEIYNSLVAKSGYTDSEDDILRLALFIENSEMFDKDTYVWFGKFDEFLPHQLRVIEALLKKCVNVTVCVPYPENDNGIYAPLSGTFDKINDLAYKYGCEDMISLDGSLCHIENNHELKFLFENWNSNHAVYKEETENISLFESRDAYGETEYAACRILDLVREGGMRFKDIAVLCGNEEEYSHLVETVFSEYEIPYFTDSTIILSDHPIAMQILSLFDIFENDWDYEPVFGYLRAGFIYRKANGKTVPLSQSDVDRLENFVLRCGIRSQSKWLGDEPWTKPRDTVSEAFGNAEETECESGIELLRQEIIAPIKAFKEATARRKTAREHAAALFEFFEAINLYAGLKAETDDLRAKGNINEAEQFTKIWNLLLDVINQTVITSDDEKINRTEFSEYIKAGLSKCEIRTIPSGIDQVYVGTVERSSQSNVRAMFVIGAVGGTFPEEFASEGFLSNSDRGILLEEYSISIAPDTKRKMEKQYFKVYRAMCAVTDKLFLSYPLQNSEGRALRASRMIIDIKNRFPKIKIYDNLPDTKEEMYISSPRATIHKMLVAKSENGKSSPIWEAAYKWYEKSGDWDKMLSMLDRAAAFSKRHIHINGDAASELFGNIGAYSASRLNSYAKCPFGHFLRYGLKAYERPEWDITPAEVGSYAHAVIREFCERVEDGAKTSEEKLRCWRELPESGGDGKPSREDILDGIIEKTRENIMNSTARDKERTANIFSRMGKTIRGAAKVVHMSFKNGKYSENGMERHFELELGGGIAIKGDIDRMDVFEESQDRTRVRIIDYKTGSTSFDVVDVFNGIDMQPVIYAVAAAEMVRRECGKEAAVTGIYYNKVRDDFAKLKYSDDISKAGSTHEKERKLDGITFIDNSGDNRVIYDMDNGLEIGNPSVFLNIDPDAEGGIKPTERVKTRAQIEGLMEHVKDRISEIDMGIKSGNISLSPYSSAVTDACRYCEYAPVCAFDEDKRILRQAEGTAGEIWDEMSEKGGGE